MLTSIARRTAATRTAARRTAALDRRTDLQSVTFLDRGKRRTKGPSCFGRLGLAALFALTLASASVQAQEAALEPSGPEATASDRRGRGLASAALPGSASAPTMTNLKHIVHQIQGANESMEMIVNTSRILSLGQKIPKAQVNNPDILELTPLSATQIQIMAKKPGVTQVNLWDEDDGIHSIDVIVFADSQELTILLKQQFPKASLKVIPLPNSVMITGYVDDPNIVRRIIDIANEYSPKVLNNITVGGVQQVLLQIKVIEVSRNKLRTMGFDWGNLARRGDLFTQGVGGLLKTAAGAGTVPQGIPAGTGLGAIGTQTMTFGVVSAGDSFFGVLNLLQQRDVAKVLAEPNLTTVSGRPAFFNVGGEFPILVPQSLGTISVQYRKFGTQVDFVPIVLGNGAIRLEVRPRVSEIDESRSITINGTTVPGLKTREVDTGAEMQAGQTLAIAGLVQLRTEDVNTGIPWLSDLPFVGVPFRKMTEQINEVELLILVTPQLIEAMDPDQVPTNLPGMASTVPNEWQFYGKGHVEVPNCDPTGQLLGPYPGGGPFGHPAQAGMGPGGMIGPGPMAAPGGMMSPGSAPPVQGLPPGAREIPTPSGETPPAAPSPQDQSRRRTNRPTQGMGLGPDSGRLPDVIRLPETSRLPETGRPQATGRSSRRRPAATDNVQGIPAMPRRPSLQKTSSRNKTPSPAASNRQKSSPGFIGPTGYDLR
jgi:pilus assembly protein CpaC